jgi:hypothetical protein
MDISVEEKEQIKFQLIERLSLYKYYVQSDKNLLSKSLNDFIDDIEEIEENFKTFLELKKKSVIESEYDKIIELVHKDDFVTLKKMENDYRNNMLRNNYKLSYLNNFKPTPITELKYSIYKEMFGVFHDDTIYEKIKQLYPDFI